MGFKPKQNKVITENSGSGSSTPREPFVTPKPEEGLQPATVSVIVSLGTQKRTPYTKTDDKGNDVMDEAGNPVILSPEPNEQVAMYVDLNEDYWDYGDPIGKKQIRLNVHEEFAGSIKEGLNFKEQGHFDANKNYIKGKPWTLPPSSKFAKIANVCGAKEIMEAGDYEDNVNEAKSDISRLIGKPFLYNVVVRENTKGDRTYINVYLKTPVPLMKGMTPTPLEAEPICINFYSEVEELVETVPLLRSAVRKKIMEALDYDNINYDDPAAEPTPSNMKIAFDQLGVNKWGHIDSGAVPNKEGDTPPWKDKAKEEGAEQEGASNQSNAKPKGKPVTSVKKAESKPQVMAEGDPDDDAPFN